MFCTERSPLARLVLFMICLSIAGTAVATVYYAAVDLPAQNALTAPENSSNRCVLIKDMAIMFVMVHSGEWRCEEVPSKDGIRTFRCCQ